MANGDIFGTRRAWGQVAHSDGSATTVAQLALPTGTDGTWYVDARFVTVASSATAGFVGTLRARVVVDTATLTIADATVDKTDGSGTGFDAALDVSGGNVRVRVTAASGRRSVAVLEAFGVEQEIVLA